MKEGDLLPLITPGDILFHEFMEPYGLSMNKLALNLHVPANAVAGIVHGTRAISSQMALRLGLFFKTTPEFWINAQAHYELEKTKREVGEKIAKEVRPLELKLLSVSKN
jgi:addiction module HigA family antidote